MKSISLSEAKARFSDCVRSVEGGELLLITRHDKPVAALIKPENIQQLERLQAAGPEGGLASLAGGWEETEELIRLVTETPHTGYRIIPDLD